MVPVITTRFMSSLKSSANPQSRSRSRYHLVPQHAAVGPLCSALTADVTEAATACFKEGQGQPRKDWRCHLVPQHLCLGMCCSILVAASGDKSRMLLSCLFRMSSCPTSAASFTFSTCLPPRSTANCPAHLAKLSSSSFARVPLLSFTPGTGVGLKAPSLRASL